MRIGMLTSAGFPPREGIGFYVWNLTRALKEKGHTVQIITRGKAERTRCQVIDGVPIWFTPFVPMYPFHVHLHGFFVNRLLARLELELDVLHIHSPLVHYPKTRLPSMITIHTPIGANLKHIQGLGLLETLFRMQAPISRRLEEEAFRLAGMISAVSSSVAQDLADYGVDPVDVAIVSNAVDTGEFHPATNRLRNATPYFITVGRLAPRKGLEDLIECARVVAQRRPEVRFMIAGEGPFRSRLEKQIARLGLVGRVVLLGHIADRKQLADLYRGAVAYLHPAHYEGLPTVLLEAMASGCPVVATAIGGAEDVVKDQTNGLLVPPHAPASLARAATMILENPESAQRLGEAASLTITSRFTWDHVSDQVIAHYHGLLSSQPGAIPYPPQNLTAD